MEADLRTPTFLDLPGPSLATPAAFFADVGVEVAVARAFAECAGRASCGGGAVVALRFFFPPWGQEQRWTRASRDACRRCVDRAMTRVYPPIDPVRYLSSDSPTFDSDALALTFSLHIAADAPVTYGVEGIPSSSSSGRGLGGGDGDDSGGGSLPEFLRPMALPERRDSGPTVADAAEVAQAAVDADLWRRARATRSDSAFFDALVSSAPADSSERERELRLTRRLSRHAVERLVNERSWAAPAPAPARGGGHALHGRLTSPAYAPLFTESTAAESVPRRSAFASVVEAAAAAGRRGDRGADAALTRTARHGRVHVDVRGMAFTAWVVAHTGRFAYLGCPVSAGPGAAAAAALVLVARVALPSWLAAGVTGSARGPRKRGRAPETEPVEEGARVPTLALGNVGEATLHDNSGPLVELPREAWTLVDVRAHRVLCHAGPPPDHVRVWFEDAFITGRHAGAASATDVAVLTVPELLRLVQASCARYVADRTALQERWRDMCAEERADVACQRRAQQRQRQLEHAQGDEEGDEEESTGEADDASAQVEVASCASSVGAIAESAVVAGVGREVGEDSDEARVARRRRQFARQLFRAFDVLLKAVSDPSATAFAKSRARGAAPGPTPPLPVARTCADVQQLEEGAMVEFKYTLGTAAGAITDAQRLRNTMAAMAGTLGGVVCVGVTDDGVALGQPQGVVRAALRVSGFCPAMATNAIAVRDVRVMPAGCAERGPTVCMPKDWWKAPPAPPAGTATTTTTATGSQGRVVTVISVAKGAAPFYASGRTALPYVRGCASTTPMPTRVMWERLLAELSASAA